MKLGIVPKPIEPVLKRGQPQGNDSTEKGFFPVVRILRMGRRDGEARPIGLLLGPLVKPGMQ